jgi:hypothetical protein
MRTARDAFGPIATAIRAATSRNSNASRDVADEFANHGYRGVGLDDFQNAALSQLLAILQT